VPPFLGILIRPQATWRQIRAADPSWARSLFGHALPLALLPSIAWPLGQSFFAGSAALSGSAAIAKGFMATLFLSLMSVALFALGLYLLSGFFRVARRWDRAMAVAAYASTPVLLCGALLVFPLLVIASVGGFLYGLALCSTGLQEMLGCREQDAAAFIASAAVFLGASSMAAGALCGAIGLL
jgi:hypothetical protein